MSFPEGKPAWAQPGAYTGSVAPGATALLDFVNDAAGLEPGTYTTTVWLITSDTEHTIVQVPWVMQVTSVVLFPDSVQESLPPLARSEVLVTVVNMRPVDILVYLNYTAADTPWLAFTVVPHCIPSGSMASFQASVAYTADAVPGLGLYDTTLNVLGFRAGDPYSGLHVDGAPPDTTTCTASDTYTIAPTGVNASAAIDTRQFYVAMTAQQGPASPQHSTVALVEAPAAAGVNAVAANTGTPIRIGEDVELVITARDVFGHASTTGGDAFTVDTEFRGVASVSDNRNGTYTVLLRATELGVLPLHVRVATQHGEQDIVGSPVDFLVLSPVCLRDDGLSLSRDGSRCECASGFGFVAGADGDIAASNATCRPCRAGMVKAEAGDRPCAVCGTGTVALTDGLTECSRCAAGSVASGDRDKCIPCTPGTHAPSSGMASCLKCASNEFSYVGAVACQPCPGDGTICAGGALAELLPGFWREDPSKPVTADTEFFQCPNPSACIVDTAWSSLIDPASLTEEQKMLIAQGFNVTQLGVPATGGNMTCAEGTRGALCSVCAPGYAGAGGVCSKCWSPAASWAASAAIVGFVIAAVGFMVHRNVASSATAGELRVRHRAKSRSKMKRVAKGDVTASPSLIAMSSDEDTSTGGRGFRRRGDASSDGGDTASVSSANSATDERRAGSPATGAVRVMVNFLQASSMLGTFRIKGPALVADMLGYTSVGDGVSLDAFPIQCALGGLSYYTQLFTYMALPVVVVTSVALYNLGKYAAARRRIALATRAEARFMLQGKRLRRHLAARFTTTVLIVMFLLHNRLTKEIVSVFATLPFKVFGRTVLREDVSVATDTDEYTLAAILGGVCVFVYIIGFPLGAAWLLYKNRRRLDTAEVQGRYGFLYQGLKIGRGKGQYMYEVAVSLRKVCIVVVAVVVEDPFLQIWTASLILGVSLALQLATNPYVTRTMNTLEGASLTTMLCTQMGSILYWRETTVGDASTAFETMVTLVLLGINGIMMIVFVVTIVRLARKPGSGGGDKDTTSLLHATPQFTKGGFPRPPPSAIDTRRGVFAGPASHGSAKGLELQPGGATANPMFQRSKRRTSTARSATRQSMAPQRQPHQQQQQPRSPGGRTRSSSRGGRDRTGSVGRRARRSRGGAVVGVGRLSVPPTVDTRVPSPIPLATRKDGSPLARALTRNRSGSGGRHRSSSTHDRPRTSSSGSGGSGSGRSRSRSRGGRTPVGGRRRPQGSPLNPDNV